MDGWRGSLSRTICQNLPEKQEGLPEGANHHAASQGTRLSVEQACAGESKVQCGSAVEFLHLEIMLYRNCTHYFHSVICTYYL